jgi:hypothetical protein
MTQEQLMIRLQRPSMRSFLHTRSCSSMSLNSQHVSSVRAGLSWACKTKRFSELGKSKSGYAYPLWLYPVVWNLLNDCFEVFLRLDLNVGEVKNLRRSLFLVQDVLQLELGVGHGADDVVGLQSMLKDQI